MNNLNDTSRYHSLHVQLTSEQLLSFYSWLHDANLGFEDEHVCGAIKIVRNDIRNHIVSNLDKRTEPYVTVDDNIVLPLSKEKLERLAHDGREDSKTAPRWTGTLYIHDDEGNHTLTNVPADSYEPADEDVSEVDSNDELF